MPSHHARFLSRRAQPLRPAPGGVGLGLTVLLTAALLVGPATTASAEPVGVPPAGVTDGSAVGLGSTAPVPPEAASGVLAVAAGGWHSLALTVDGAVIAWGDVGNGNEAVPAAAGSGVRAIAAGYVHSLALTADGTVIAWGDNAFGKADVPPAALSGITAISAGGDHGLALTEGGAVIRWGVNSDVPPEATTGVTAIASGSFHDLALTAEGRVIAWGDNDDGQVDVPAAALSGITAIAAGANHSLALTAGGGVLAWGQDDYGLNDVPAAATSGVVAIAAGRYHSLALKADGSLVGWGDGGSGETTAPAVADNGVLAIAAGWYFSVLVVRVAPTLTDDAPPASATVGEPYSYTFAGRSSPDFYVVGGALPPGLTLDAASGALSGTPLTAGSYAFRIGAGNGVSPDALGAEHTITVEPALALVAASPPATAPIGAPYSYTFTATGNPAPTFSVVGTLPAGLALDAVTGVLSGTPTGQGPSTFSVRVSNGVQPDATSAPITLTVTRPATLTADAPATTLPIGAPYSYTFTASGHPASTFTATGDLPAGLTLDPTTGVLSGTPTATGSSTFTVTATNGISPAAVGAAHTLTVTGAPALVDDAPPLTAPLGDPYSYTFTAGGFPAVTFAVASGSLPPGLTLDPATGVLSGTPTASGPYTFAVGAANGIQPAAIGASHTVAVTAAPAFTADAPPLSAAVDQPYTYAFVATGYPAPTFTATGDVPAGLTLDPTTGVLSGTPTAAGSSTFTVTATNGISPAAVGASHTVVVTAAPVPVTPAPVPVTPTPDPQSPARPLPPHPVVPTPVVVASPAVVTPQPWASPLVLAVVRPSTPVPAAGSSLAYTGVDGAGLMALCGFVLVSTGALALVALRRRRA